MASPPRRHVPSPSPPPPLSKPLPLEAEVTVVSAKHLKNVNWRHGDLKPYAVFYLDPDRRLATKPDDSGSVRPVWNERFVLPVPPGGDPVITLEIFHSRPSETPKPLVGTAQALIGDLVENFPDASYSSCPGGGGGPGPVPIRTLELRRPSGRPQGKVRIKVTVREVPPPASPQPSTVHPDYHVPPPSSYFYSSAPPPPSHLAPPPPSHLAPPPPSSVRDFRSYAPPPPLPSYIHNLPPPATSQYPYSSYSDPYSGYGPSGGYYSAPPVPPTRPYYNSFSGYGGSVGPSAPVDYTSGPSSYDQKARSSGKMGLGAGLAVGAVAGALGGMALEEGLKYKEEKIAERVESDRVARDDYIDYREDY